MGWEKIIEHIKLTEGYMQRIPTDKYDNLIKSWMRVELYTKGYSDG